VLNQFNVFNDVLLREAPTLQYTVNRTTYNMGYYLIDDIAILNELHLLRQSQCRREKGEVTCPKTITDKKSCGTCI